MNRLAIQKPTTTAALALVRLQRRADPLKITEPDDDYEQEAERIAATVMSGGAPTAGGFSFSQVGVTGPQRKCACGGSAGPAGECEECAKEGSLQRRTAPTAGREERPTALIAGPGEQCGFSSSQGGAGRGETWREGQDAPPIVHEVLRSPGQALDADARAFMEPRFAYDFSQVRIHTDSKAAESARAVSALAYTVGQDIVFADGRYDRGTNAGRRLIAHELAHVLQQMSSSVEGGSPDGSLSDHPEAPSKRAPQMVAGQVLQRDDDGSIPIVEIPTAEILRFRSLEEPFFRRRRCNMRIKPMACEELTRRYPNELDEQFQEYKFECPFGDEVGGGQVPCSLQKSIFGPWIMVSTHFPSRGSSESFACGETATICAGGRKTEATVVERRMVTTRDDAWVDPDVATTLKQPTNKAFEGVVLHAVDTPSSFACCPQEAEPGPGDYNLPGDDQANV